MMFLDRRRVAVIVCGVAVWAAAAAPALADDADPWPAGCAAGEITGAAVDAAIEEIVVFGSATLCPDEKYTSDLRFGVLTFPRGAERVSYHLSDLRPYAQDGPRPFGATTGSHLGNYGVCVMASVGHRVACAEVVLYGFRLAVRPIPVDHPLVSATVDPVPVPDRGTGGECGSCF